MRLKLTVAYAGGAYAGWQRQPAADTIQGRLERAIAQVQGQPARVVGAGRTDAGVHACGQVAHVDVQQELQPDRWRGAINAFLPVDIRVLEVTAVDDAFHARRDATAKLYRYQLQVGEVACPLAAAFAWHVGARFDLDAAAAAAETLAGPVDQRAFATRPEAGGRPVRGFDWVRVARAPRSTGSGDLIWIEVHARSFLRQVVRGLAGTLVQVGQGRRAPESLAELARSGDRSAAGPTAPARGLCLVRVEYGPEAVSSA